MIKKHRIYFDKAVPVTVPLLPFIVQQYYLPLYFLQPDWICAFCWGSPVYELRPFKKNSHKRYGFSKH